VLAVSADQTTIRAGQVVGVKVSAINEGDATVTVLLPACAHPIEIHGASGGRIEHPVGILCALVGTAPIALAPGREITVTGAWLSRTGVQSEPVPPGSYRLRPANFQVSGGALVRYIEATVSVTG
jgi:hypothetical protein